VRLRPLGHLSAMRVNYNTSPTFGQATGRV